VTAWTLFYNPITLSSGNELWLLLPLCAAVGIIYKTIRASHLRVLAREILFLMVYMVVGLVALCVGLWAIQEYWP
jgi:hypothetical protein